MLSHVPQLLKVRVYISSREDIHYYDGHDEHLTVCYHPVHLLLPCTDMCPQANQCAVLKTMADQASLY